MKDDRIYLRHIREAIQDIEEYARVGRDAFMTDKMRQDALLRKSIVSREPQTLAMVFAIARDELVTLSIRSWPREDLAREVERILESFEVIGER